MKKEYLKPEVEEIDFKIDDVITGDIPDVDFSDVDDPFRI